MAYLDSGFARHQGGPDFVNGTGLDLLFEEWDYAWSPVVEARLIERSELGSSLREVAIRRLLDEEQALQASGQAAVPAALRNCSPEPGRSASASNCHGCSTAWPSTWTKTRSWPPW